MEKRGGVNFLLSVYKNPPFYGSQNFGKKGFLYTGKYGNTVLSVATYTS